MTRNYTPRHNLGARVGKSAPPPPPPILDLRPYDLFRFAGRDVGGRPIYVATERCGVPTDQPLSCIGFEPPAVQVARTHHRTFVARRPAYITTIEEIAK